MPLHMIRKLDLYGGLSAEEKHVLESITWQDRDYGADQDMLREGDRPSDCILIREGFACRYKLLANGKRQIMAFQIPGDICDLNGFLLDEIDHNIGTLTPCNVALIPHATIRDMTEKYPRINRALWRTTLIDAGIFRAWMTNIGRRDAYERVAHLFCETFLRLRSVGLANERDYELPVTQAEIGDSLGLSTVHVNRTLQKLRGDGLITLRGPHMTINDWEGLTRAADFNPNYLHLGANREPANQLKRAARNQQGEPI
jgi:CRP-like cAMP-binding protein